MSIAQRRDIVVVGASAGGIEVLRELLSRLPGGLRAAVLVVLHIPPTSGGALANILDRSGPLPAAAAQDGEEIQPGHVYVAPPDRHLLIDGSRVLLSHGPRQNGHRPAADPLFTSAAATCRSRVLAVVLSGTLDDGAAGAAVVERRGGLVAVQDPATSAYAGMPAAALAATQRARVLAVPEIAALIVRSSDEAVPGYEGDPAHPSGVPLDPDPVVEQALWMEALRLDEQSRITQGMADEAGKRGQPLSAARFREAARETDDALTTIRKLLERVAVPEDQDDDI